MPFNHDVFTSDINNKRLVDDLNLRQAARQIGISASTLSRIENGNPPEIETFGRICQWLKEPPSKYFDPDAKRSNPEYPALDIDDVIMLREYGLHERDIAGLNRYVQAIIDERDFFAIGKPLDLGLADLPKYES